MVYTVTSTTVACLPGVGMAWRRGIPARTDSTSIPGQVMQQGQELMGNTKTKTPQGKTSIRNRNRENTGRHRNYGLTPRRTNVPPFHDVENTRNMNKTRTSECTHAIDIVLLYMKFTSLCCYTVTINQIYCAAIFIDHMETCERFIHTDIINQYWENTTIRVSKLLLTENIQYTIHYYNKKQNPAILCLWNKNL